jgi:hypothetical protein
MISWHRRWPTSCRINSASNQKCKDLPTRLRSRSGTTT